MNKFKFYLSGLVDGITENKPIWKSPLPVSRFKEVGSGNGVAVTYGDYFKAAERFLSENHFHRLISSIYQQSGIEILPEAIQNISVYLEKHGEFYHPSKIEISTDNQRWEFVLNIAVSLAGKACIRNEFELLKKLGTQLPWGFIPVVYEQGEVFYGSQSPVDMFLAEWFSGFCEFHICKKEKSSNCQIEVWNQSEGNFFLSEKQAYEVYRQAARIHTCYHNLDTFEQIHPWHHAAGDFVVKVNEDKVAVRLVTVRGYHPLINNDKTDPKSKLEALAFFLMDLSLKNRMDRFNGVGDIAWVDDIFVMATITGFFEGLYQKIGKKVISRKTVDHLANYLDFLSHAGTGEFFDHIISAWPRSIPEWGVVREKLKTHAEVFEYCINQFLSVSCNNKQNRSLAPF